MKKLFAFCDGTNNTLTGGTRDTNVLILCDWLIKLKADTGHDWLVHYDPGVGSANELPPSGLAGVVRQ